MTIGRKLGVAALIAGTVAATSIAGSTSADAHWRGGGWIGPAIVGGLVLGAFAASRPYAYGYGYPAYGYGYGYPAYRYGGYYRPHYAYAGPCHWQRRVRHTSRGPVVRRVRVCHY
jgi:hypothetical protein